MARAIDRFLWPEIYGPHPLFVDGDDDEDDDIDLVGRREYRIMQRAEMNDWDDVDFFRRFRLTKPTFVRVLQLVGPELEHMQPRWKLMCNIVENICDSFF